MSVMNLAAGKVVVPTNDLLRYSTTPPQSRASGNSAAGIESEKGSGFRLSPPVALRVVDPGLKRRARPTRGSAPQVNRLREATLRDAPIDRRTAERGDARHVVEPKEGGQGV